jgi:hypothetical protein
MTRELVTIKAFNFPQEAALAHSFLDAEGIYSFIMDELITQVYSLTTNVFGGVKLQVREEDVQRAVELLYAAGYLTSEDLKPDTYDEKLYHFLSRMPFVKNFVGKKEDK